ncbi:MAG: 1,4-dihydroxy-2-naphthoate octaprenyltransferase [Halobacteria archaeon]
MAEFSGQPAPVNLRVWLREFRLPFATLSIALVGVGTAAAALAGPLDPGLLLLTLAGILLIHVGTNTVNDVFDYAGGTDRVNREPTPFSGGSRVLVEGLLKPGAVYRVALACLAAGSAIGLYLAWARGWPILALGLVGVGLGFFYVEPRVNLAARGLGELAVGLGFGPLIVGGTYYVQTQRFDPPAIAAGTVMGLMVAAVLWVNELPDYTADRESGKRNLVVRLGRERAARVFPGLLGAAYALLAASVALRLLPPTALLPLLTLPMAAKAVRIARAHHSETPKLIPANAATVMGALFSGILLTAGIALGLVLP